MKYETELLAALEAVPTIDDLDSLRDASNEAENVLLVPTAAELKILMSDLEQILGWIPDVDRLESDVRHESQHHSAAEKVGITATRFGIKLFNHHDRPGFTDYFPFFEITSSAELPLTVLEVASVVAHPISPSRGDMNWLLDYGFEGVEHVAELALANNIQGQKFIPVPLSYRL